MGKGKQCRQNPACSPPPEGLNFADKVDFIPIDFECIFEGADS